MEEKIPWNVTFTLRWYPSLQVSNLLGSRVLSEWSYWTILDRYIQVWTPVQSQRRRGYGRCELVVLAFKSFSRDTEINACTTSVCAYLMCIVRLSCASEELVSHFLCTCDILADLVLSHCSTWSGWWRIRVSISLRFILCECIDVCTSLWVYPLCCIYICLFSFHSRSRPAQLGVV